MILKNVISEIPLLLISYIVVPIGLLFKNPLPNCLKYFDNTTPEMFENNSYFKKLFHLYLNPISNFSMFITGLKKEFIDFENIKIYETKFLKIYSFYYNNIEYKTYILKFKHFYFIIGYDIISHINNDIFKINKNWVKFVYRFKTYSVKTLISFHAVKNYHKLYLDDLKSS